LPRQGLSLRVVVLHTGPGTERPRVREIVMTGGDGWCGSSAAAAALRYFALDGTDHATYKEQASMIRRYIIWRSNHAYDERPRHIVNRANVA
jgi:hypothetical protein